MFNSFFTRFRNSSVIEKAVVISIVVGIAITAILIAEKKEEGFTSLYIYPDSYTNYPSNDSISFSYGVKSFEKEKISYDLEILIGDQSVDRKNFEINPGEVHEENETIKIRNIRFPVKVNLVLKSPSNTYTAYYWLKSPQETPVRAPAKAPAEEVPVATAAITPVTTEIISVTPTVTPVITEITPAITPEITPVTPAITPVSPNATAGPTQTFVPVLIDTRYGFNPKEVTIKAGDAVRWTNHDMLERTFTLMSNEGLFTREMDSDRRFEFKFNSTGTYTFYLEEYSSVKGVVIVK